MSATAPPQLENVILTVSDGVGVVELNRPQALNAWNRQLGADLLDAVRFVAEAGTVRAVLLRGGGRAFSSGADLRDLTGREEDLTPDGRPDVQRVLTERYHPIITAIRQMEKPVVAAVNGPAVGIGLSLALSCDLVIAARSAYFLQAFVNIGLVPDGGASLFVPARVGMARAAEMAMLGERIDAAQALAWGLVNRVVDDENLQQEAGALTARLAAGPTRAYAGIKRQLNRCQYSHMAEQLELEASIQLQMAGTHDFSEGVGAFVEKRAATFRGA